MNSLTDAPSVRVLVVSDSQVTGGVLAEALVRYRAQASVCRDAREALEYLAESAPDAAVIDSTLEGAHALQVYIAVRACDPQASIPIYFVNYQGSLGRDIESESASGADVYVPASSEPAAVARLIVQSLESGRFRLPRAMPLSRPRRAAMSQPVRADEHGRPRTMSRHVAGLGRTCGRSSPRLTRGTVQAALTAALVAWTFVVVPLISAGTSHASPLEQARRESTKQSQATQPAKPAATQPPNAIATQPAKPTATAMPKPTSTKAPTQMSATATSLPTQAKSTPTSQASAQPTVPATSATATPPKPTATQSIASTSTGTPIVPSSTSPATGTAPPGGTLQSTGTVGAAVSIQPTSTASAKATPRRESSRSSDDRADSSESRSSSGRSTSTPTMPPEPTQTPQATAIPPTPTRVPTSTTMPPTAIVATAIPSSPTPTPLPPTADPGPGSDNAGPPLVMAAFYSAGAGGSSPAISGFGSCDRAFQYWEPLESAAHAAGIDPAIMAALLVVEGSGERAVSPAGAMGLMQLMPDKFRSGDDPFNIPTNFARAAQHIALLQGIYGPNERIAAAYFGAIGPGGVITGASDGNVNGFEYVRRYEAALGCVHAGLSLPVTALGGLFSPMGGPLRPANISFGFLDDYGHSLATYIRGAHGVQQYGTRHLAWDLIVPGAPANGRGSAVFAPMSGRIIRTSDPVGGPFGIWIENSALDLRIRLMHMDGLAAGLSTGVEVRAGQWVGLLGGQGTESFPHLHISLELLSTGERLDPARFFFRPDLAPRTADVSGTPARVPALPSVRPPFGSAVRSLTIPGAFPVSRPASSANTVVWAQRDTDGTELLGYDLELGLGFRLGAATVSDQSPPALSGERVVWLDARRAAAASAVESAPITNDVYTFDLSTGREQRLSAVPGHYSAPVISEHRAAWVSRSGSMQSIHVHDLTTNVHTVHEWSFGEFAELALFGPWLAYIHTVGSSAPERTIRAVNLDTGQSETLAHGRLQNIAIANESVYWLERTGTDDLGQIRGSDLGSGQVLDLPLPPARRSSLVGSDGMLLWEEQLPDRRTGLRAYGISSGELESLADGSVGTIFGGTFGHGTAAWSDAGGQLSVAYFDEWDVGDGRFFADPGGSRRWAGRPGHHIENAGGIPFWREFQRLGGVGLLGRPLTERFMLSDGFVYQLTERALLQWRPELGEAVLANSLELLEGMGHDVWLHATHQVPFPIADDAAGANWELARDTRLSWMTDTIIRERFLASTDPSRAANWTLDDSIALYGLPMSLPEDFGPFVAQRFQRAVLRHWKDQDEGSQQYQSSLIVPIGAIMRAVVLPDAETGSSGRPG